MPETRERLITFCKRVWAVLENPDLLIQKSPQFPEETEAVQRVIDAITRKNNLRQSIEDRELEIQRLEKEIEAAESDDEALTERLQSEQADYQDQQAAATELLQEALQEVEDRKTDLMQEREAHYQLTREKKTFSRFIERFFHRRELTVSGDEKR